MQLKLPNTVRASLLVLGLMASPALAESLPTSSTPAIGAWREMHPSTFPGTHKSAVDQCLRDAALDMADLLTPEKCELARQKLATGDYKVAMVKDGVVHDFMNGRGSVSRNVVKATGRIDRALLLDLGNGVHMYWYTGDRGRSCNNAGITIVVPVATPIVVPPAPPAIPPEPKCRLVKTGSRSPMSDIVSTPMSFYQDGCWFGPNGMILIPGISVNFGGSPGDTYELVCD
jgi:hypothetical protein